MRIINICVLGLLFIGASCASAMAQENMDSLNNVTEKSRGVVDKVQADELYTNGKFQEAASIYEQILEEQGVSPFVYYNLGNCYYKTSEWGKAILNYERALLLKPGDGDIRFNLELAKSKTIDKITPLRELFFVTWAKDFANLLSADGWAKWAIGLFIAFVCALSVYLFSNKMALRKCGFSFAIISLLCCVLANFSAKYQADILKNGENAIVMLPSVTVKSTPDKSGTDLFVLHEGCKVAIKDASMREWKEIRLADGNVGWIPANALEII